MHLWCKNGEAVTALGEWVSHWRHLEAVFFDADLEDLEQKRIKSRGDESCKGSVGQHYYCVQPESYPEKWALYYCKDILPASKEAKSQTCLKLEWNRGTGTKQAWTLRTNSVTSQPITITCARRWCCASALQWSALFWSHWQVGLSKGSSPERQLPMPQGCAVKKSRRRSNHSPFSISHTVPCKPWRRCSPIPIMWISAVVNSISPTMTRQREASKSLLSSIPNLKCTNRYRESREKYRARRFT